jgi:hypothetical protein
MASYTYEFIDLGDEHALGCKCCRFSKGVDLPIPKKLSHAEIAKLARAFSLSIFKDWSKLNAILKRFEGTIHKRWLKKSPKQRRELLLKAWPDMPMTHRPDFAGFRKVLKNAPRTRTLPSSAYLWPYINLEDLMQRHHLLLFINSRGRNLPALFAQTDLRSAHLGHGWRPCEDEDDLRMELFGQSTPATYGRLLTIEATLSPTIQRIVHTPARGLLVLEIQQQIYEFLSSCVHLILHDIHPRQFSVAPHLPTPKMPEADTNEWPSLGALALEAPYMAPQAIDLNRLIVMAGARRQSAEDHLWLLTEDPGYFIESLKEWKEHSQDTMQHDCSRCWRRVAERMIGDAFTLFTFWHWIYRQLTRMVPFDKQLGRADYNGLRLDKRDEKLWVELILVVQTMIAFPISALSLGLSSSPRMRHCYYDPKSVKQGSPEYKEVPQKLTDAERRVDILFHAIMSDEKRELHTLNHLVQETQHMLDTDAEASRLVDSWLSSIFADLAMLSELSTRIESLEPWASGWYASDLLFTEDSRKPMGDLLKLETKLRSGLEKAFSNGEMIDAVGFLDYPLDGRFDYPAAKQHTEANVEQMRFAEALLDELWAEIEFYVLETKNLSLTKVIKNRLSEPRKKYRTPEWMPPLVALAKAPVLTERSTNVPRFGEGTKVTEVVTPAKEKTKIKTRGLASTPKEDEDKTSFSTETSTPSTTTTIKVPKRAYKVLSALFPAPGAASHQRTEIAWEELLQAMNTIGFQPMKLYGSVWMFMPKGNGECKVEAKRSIQFHEPKEVRRGSKIPASMVRTFGRRMKHAFGWEDGMFVCE